MKFDELNDMIPYVVGGKEKSLHMDIYPDVRLLFPGRHAKDTIPPGGDFCVTITDPVFKSKHHQFTHTDIFKDVELKTTQGKYQDLMHKDAEVITHELMKSYLEVITGADPSSVLSTEFDYLSGIRGGVFLRAVQCLAVAEHRRYHMYESKWGGRFLPFRFAAGIAKGLWSADEATAKQKYGRPAVERLEKEWGIPALTYQLMQP